ncbi:MULTISPECIES: LysE family translocator [Pseudovibrio]|uniref:LysE family translocator n=1 Tax=Stappiaceae TaxID=2821832 RepID=UPI002365D50C|nr:MULTISPECIES: LysE family translocator [Pseudovibrio]MDD7912120.1 LysE family translocator [Pseudovibrio exalbescens]MDX5592468.1 LysE family translocator [Pseudovibrio sp. SPO723]
MIPIETLSAFVAVVIVLALTPGPDNLFVLTQSAVSGRLSGIAVTFGLSTGVIFHTIAVALGVAAIFQTSALAFSLLKYAGAAYLLYLAWGAFRAKAAPIGVGGGPKLSYWALYRRGVIMNITNPKVSIFFLSFLPQFVNPQAGPLFPQFIQLGFVFILCTILVFGGIAVLAGTIGEKLGKSASAQSIMNKIAGTVFVGLALKLATTTR